MVDEMNENEASQKEKAEGSRENVNVGTGAGNPMERGGGQETDNAGGISNRPLSEEQEQEQHVPPRGQSKK